MAVTNTPIHQLPWPDGTERVMDGDNAIRALAEAVDRELEELAKLPGVIVSGPAQVGLGSASPIRLQLDALLLGPASWFDNANDQVIVPSGTPDGMYAVEVYASVTNVAATQAGLALFVYYGSAGAPAPVAASSVVGGGTALAYVGVSTTIRLQAGQVVAAYVTNPVADVGDWQLRRLTVRRVSDVFPGTLLRDRAELTPA